MEGDRRIFLLVASNPDLSTSVALVLVEFRHEQPLGFMGVGVEREPALVVGVHHPRRMDTRGDKPFSHCLNSLLGWRKDVVHLVCRPVLAVFGRLGVRSAPTSCQHVSRSSIAILKLGI